MEKCSKCGKYNWNVCGCKLFYLAQRDDLFIYSDKRELGELNPQELKDGYWRKIYSHNVETAAERYLEKLCYNGDGLVEEVDVYVFDGKQLVRLKVAAELVVETRTVENKTINIDAIALEDAINDI